MELLNIQYGILGHMLVYPEHVGEIMTRLAADDFDSLPTRGLFEAIGHLHFSGKPIDPVTVELEAGDGYKPAVEAALQHTASDWSYYCNLLREGIQLKKIHSYANALAETSTMADAGKVIDTINGLSSLRKNAKIVTAHEAAVDFMRRMSDKQKPEYLSLGMPDLDRMMYLELGDFVLLGGLASSGKTMLSLQFALALTKKYRVGYFTMETNTRKLTDRLVAHMAQVPLPAIKEHSLSGEAAQRAADASRRLDKLNLDFIHSSGMAIQDIRAITLNQRYQVIFVDYLQIVDAPGKGKNRYEEVTSVSIGLHTLAQSHGIAVFALAQLSRPEKTKGGTLLPPSLSSFRESGQLEQDADVALLIWPSDPNDNESPRVLKLAKNKEGSRDKLELAFNGATQTLTPVPKDWKNTAAQYIAAGRKAKQRWAAEPTGFQDIPDDGPAEPTPFDKKA